MLEKNVRNCRNSPRRVRAGGYEVNIGEHATKKFLLGKDVNNALKNLTNPSTVHITAGKVETSQAAMLEKEWNSSPSPEVELGRYTTTGDTVVIHSIKDRPHAKRLHVLEFESQRHKETRLLLSETGWKCKACPYGSTELPYEASKKVRPRDVKMHNSSILLVSPPTCALEALSDDCLYELAAYLPSESIISFSEAYPRIRYIVASSHELLRRELTCFFLRTSLQESVLGIGVALNPATRFLTSDFDWLSEEAFTKHEVRMSIRKNDFQHFLPLAFNRNHFRKAKSFIWRSLVEIDRALRQGGSRRSGRSGQRGAFKTIAPLTSQYESIRVIYQMMNNVVVSLMKSCDDVLDHSAHSNGNLLRASEKAVYAYCHLFHLAICLSGTNPAIFCDLERKVKIFVKDTKNRTKEKVPDIGELIVMITLLLALAPSKGLKVTWERMNGPVLEEVVIRNVRWILKDVPELAVMEKGRSDYRLAVTFLHAKTSLRLVMFQIAFLNLFVSTYSSNLSYLDDNYGFPHKEVPEKMVEKIKEIYSINCWSAFFSAVRFVNGTGFGAEIFSDLLRDAVRKSAERGYHTPPSINPQVLRERRTRLEDEWTRNQQQKKINV